MRLQFTDRVTDPPGLIAEPRQADETDGQAPTFFWAEFDPEGTSAAAKLAALRSGISGEAGAVPAMWPFYRTRISTELRVKGALTRDLVSEHAALTLFGVHQHGRRAPMHAPGVSPGAACRTLLRKDDRADSTALERRLGVLLTSLDTQELAHHLRGLVALLRVKDIGLDYDALRAALRYWDDPRRPDEQSRVRNRWDRDFRAKGADGQYRSHAPKA